MKLRFTKVREVKSPNYGTDGSAGLDLYIPEDFQSVTLLPGDDILIPSGLKFDIPNDTVLIIHNKSGIATKKRLQVGACVIDCDYHGEVHLHVFNTGINNMHLNPGDKIVQAIHLPYYKSALSEAKNEEELYAFKKSERGSGGFGSTGTK